MNSAFFVQILRKLMINLPVLADFFPLGRKSQSKNCLFLSLRKGKKDQEDWEHGELKSSHKFYGKGSNWEVDDWEDLKSMSDLTKDAEPAGVRQQ